MRTTPVVVLRKGRSDLAHLLDAARTVHGQAFVLIRPMVALDEPIGRSRQLHRLHL